MQANTRPVANCSSKACSTLLIRCLAFTAFATQRYDVVAFVPLSEWSSINGDNSIFHQCFGS
ncbi:GSCOCG00001773001-RA-CDS, partial [Cotesia congregata]